MRKECCVEVKWSGPAVSGGASRLVSDHLALVDVAGDGISKMVNLIGDA